MVRSASLELPPVVAARVREGEELGRVMDELSGLTASNTRMGTIGLLTGGLVVRADVWRQALSLGLAPFLRPELYPSTELHS